MKNRRRLISVLGIVAGGAFLSACASSTNLVQRSSAPRLALILGQAELKTTSVTQAQLSLPGEVRFGSGKVLMFSPLEFRSDKDRYTIDSVSLPLGRFIGVRHSDEGLLRDLKPEEAKVFSLVYLASYPSLEKAKHDFPKLQDDRFQAKQKDGKTLVQVEQWRMRLSMLFAKDRSAFRVLLDDIIYIAPLQKTLDDSEVQAEQDLPIIVAFSYRHPDAAQELVIQHNVFYEFALKTNQGRFQGSPQISGWLPLHSGATSAPYTVSIVVAEISDDSEAVSQKLLNFVKRVKEWL